MSEQELADAIVDRVNERVERKFKGMMDVLNFLAERLTGDQFTVVEGLDGKREVIIPELRRVMWHPVEVQGGADAPAPDHLRPGENRYPAPCVVRRSMYEATAGSHWETAGLAKRQQASH